MNPDFNYNPKCAKLRITQVAFANDLLLMSRGDIRSIGILLQCLREFGAAACLSKNVMKSSLYTAGIVGPELDEIQRITQIPKSTSLLDIWAFP